MPTALLLLLWCGLSMAALGGIYHGDINGTPSTLRLLGNQGHLEGEIDAGGYGPGVRGVSRGGGVVTGQWRTKNRIVYIKEQDSPQ